MNVLSISKWLKIDLHIHSVESNKYKANDYEGDKYNYSELKRILVKEGINLFSITDHNCINIELYEDLIENQDNLLKENLNFIVGCELDIYDCEIYDEIFHCLVFFDTLDIEKINKMLKELVIRSEKGYKYPNLGAIFKKFIDNEIKDFILIPHFNNKSKGLKDRDMHIKAVECLKRSVFNAYEDTNNLDKINKSFEIYSKVGHPDLPILIFSDCHDINVYPKRDKDEDKTPEFLSILGNVKHPFESLKLAFQDAEIRIGSDGLNYFRKMILPEDSCYIDKIIINNSVISFSPYQNTIIGGFGSGKSFLLNLILNGNEGFKGNLLDSYGDLLDTINTFEIITSDGIPRKSLYELKDKIDIIRFEQHEGIFYNSIIDENEKNHLEDKLKIIFPTLEPIELVDFNELIEKYNSLTATLDENITDKINYEHLFASDKFYKIKDESSGFEVVNQENLDSSELVEQLEREMEFELFGIPVYTQKEKNRILETAKLIKDKNKIWNDNISRYDKMIDYIDFGVQKFNDKQLKNNRELKGKRDVYNGIKKYLGELYNDILELKKECMHYENKLSQQQYDRYKNKILLINPGSYSLITSYKVTKEYSTINEELFSVKNMKESLFQSLLNKITNNTNFRQNKEDFGECLEKYYQDIFYKNFSEFKYDIQKDGESIMKKSAGEKANMILDIIFEIIGNNMAKDKQTILLIDQPEDHLDNENIDKNIVRKIRTMKQNNKLPQFIFVSHNANISITADSENIIIANKDGGCCKYVNSGIEDPVFIDKVCEILEGGRDALRTRGMKFSVSYLKDFAKIE